MRMPWIAVAGLLLLAPSQASRAEEPIGLKVLYAGNPGSAREKDFVSFLGEHFQKVGTAHYSKFTEADAEGYDVILFDWTSIYPRDEDGKIKEKIDRLNSPTAPKLPEDFDRPSILIGAAGGFLAQPLRLKIDWR